MKKRVVIVGAGPAGLAAANTLANEKELEIKILDRGKRVEERTRTSFDQAFGVGGVGAYSDGKFIFETIVGRRQIGTNLHELIGEEEKSYLIKAREFFTPHYEGTYNLKLEEPEKEKIERAYQIAQIAGAKDMDYVVAKDYHIGTDRLPQLIEHIEKDLEKRGVEFLTETEVIDWNEKEVITKKGKICEYDYLLIAPGRDGSHWLEKILKKRKIAHGTRPIDIGVRIETDATVLKPFTDIERDLKLEFRTKNGDLIRTFCVCPYGQVVKESKRAEYIGYDFCLVNGASNSNAISQNTNFALLVRMPLMNDANNANYGRAIAETYHVAGVDKIILQRYGDFKEPRRSKEEKMHEWRIKPSMSREDFMVGDITIGMPGRITKAIEYGIERLSERGLVEGLNQDSTLLYGPEIKFHGIKIATTDYLESTSMENIFFAGDGTGFSRGIGGSMASGIRAAEGVLKKVKNQ